MCSGLQDRTASPVSLVRNSGALVRRTEQSAVMITDMEYPVRPAFSLLTKLLDEHASLIPTLPSAPNPSTAAQGGLGPAQKGKLEATLMSYLTKYQDPKQADTIMKVQKELDETKIVLVSGSWLCHSMDAHKRSTRQSSRFWSVARSSTTWSTDPTLCLLSPRCSTRQPRRWVASIAQR